MVQILMAFIVGATVGVIFGLLKLPLPAPATFAGVMGIVGLFCGYLAISHFLN